MSPQVADLILTTYIPYLIMKKWCKFAEMKKIENHSTAEASISGRAACFSLIFGQKLLTLNLTFLYVTDSTLKPTVGIVVTD